MTGLNVPLTVRIGDKHITSQVADIAFRKEAVGGVRNLTVNLLRAVDSLEADLAPFTKVYFYDGRTAETVAEGRLSDSGRTADANGQSWDIVAFGPAQHASDIEAPVVYIDRSFEGWTFHRSDVGTGASWSSGIRPNIDPGEQGLVGSWSNGTVVATNDRAVMRYQRLYECDQELGYFDYTWIAGLVEPAWKLDFIVSTDGAISDPAIGTHAFNTAGGVASAHVVTNFSAGRNVLDMRSGWTGAPGTVGGDDKWVWVVPAVEATRFYKDGTAIALGYDGTPVAHQIVWDILPRLMPEFDGANATISEAGTTAIMQLAYPDGVTAAAVLDDLMKLEAGFRWYATPNTTGNGYGFRWEPWPSTVRYEVTLDDGGNFPLSAQSVYNRVAVRWVDKAGVTRTYFASRACSTLDDHGIVRQAIVDLGSEVGATLNAAASATTFLDEHNVPKNSGSIKVARPIRDVISGRMVEPWEIEAGELVRVRGVDSYASSLNASDSDGQTVFRIWSMDYTSADNSANLSLDADPTDLTSALVKLLNQRARR